ncbi:MAG TPA: DotU family type IV/VI secretion system protein [Gemmataceae bacterium]|nr:DotU family type IV/VI secretion system protein [Gemmataceae bacterium]
MQARIAELVHPVFRYVLALPDRLDAGEALQWDHERATLTQMLAALAAPDAPARDALEVEFDFSEQADPETQASLTLAAIRHALTCWIDEFMSQQSAWGRRWREEPLEAEIYHGAPLRKFWEEARYAETRGDRDALEVIFWCVALGYCGAWRGKPDTLQAWQMRVQALLDRTAPAWTMPASLTPSPREREMPTDLPTRRMAFSLLVGGALMLPVLTMLLWRW